MQTQTAELFVSGNNQVVSLPEEFRFEGSEVYICREGDRVILSPKPKGWRDFFEDPRRPTADFMAERSDLPQQERQMF